MSGSRDSRLVSGVIPQAAGQCGKDRGAFPTISHIRADATQDRILGCRGFRVCQPYLHSFSESFLTQMSQTSKSHIPHPKRPLNSLKPQNPASRAFKSSKNPQPDSPEVTTLEWQPRLPTPRLVEPKIRVPYFGVLIIRILLFRVLH